VIVLLCVIVGWFAGSVIWNVARNQALRRPLLGAAASDSSDADMPMLAWLPAWGFFTARVDATTGMPQSRWRLGFEAGSAAYFGLAAARLDGSVELVGALLFSLPLLVIALVDLWTRLIHSFVILAGISVGLVVALLDGPKALLSSLLAMALAAIAFAGFYVLAILIYRNAKATPFGLGDVYLAGMIGAMVGTRYVVQALLYGMVLAGVILGALLAVKVLDRKQAVPYGPYLCLGALLVLLMR
jgi:leader peptidase (prepilin peptidase) / N-methyltransferase